MEDEVRARDPMRERHVVTDERTRERTNERTNAGVGKSCLLLRFSDDQFTTSFITTIGCADKTASRAKILSQSPRGAR
jgi:hypothetical protein